MAVREAMKMHAPAVHTSASEGRARRRRGPSLVHLNSLIFLCSLECLIVFNLIKPYSHHMNSHHQPHWVHRSYRKKTKMDRTNHAYNEAVTLAKASGEKISAIARAVADLQNKLVNDFTESDEFFASAES
ncbi:hypothetical protein DdX_18706 [Ditylenchus destructor]|uniref:Uncharacterized protein n=1 Tax=Ditylenchus destructor TaxID=166010 RepID=A0AAD4QXV1_9BILA|nr:hypothetical protein DdX_18706 [Ditylenchus destructor]